MAIDDTSANGKQKHGIVDYYIIVTSNVEKSESVGN